MIEFKTIVPQEQDLDALSRHSPLKPFASETTSFVIALSKAILTSPEFRSFPEMVSFAYWMRAAHLKRLQEEFEEKAKTGILMPRGLVFHISPANVDTIFLYSLLLSMLVGNKNIVRISSKESEQVGAILQLFNEILKDPKFHCVRDRIAIVRYGHDDKVTKYFSSLCDMRVIWGGDKTVESIRAVSLSPHATEICFANKISLAVFDAQSYEMMRDKADFIHNFINDSFWFGQMACSSPRLVIWRGSEEKVKEASTDFWKHVELGLTKNPAELSDMDFLNKLVFEQSVAMGGDVNILKTQNNEMNIVQISKLTDMQINDHCGGGLFLEARIDDIAELSNLLEKKYQTIVSLGIEEDEWVGFIKKYTPEGIDRIVQVGEALTFATTWDGFDLLREFSREITIQV